MHAKGFLRIKRGTGGLGVFGDKFKVAASGHGGQDKGHEERQPDDAADLCRDFACERVDPCAQDIAHHEQQQQAGPHHTFKFGFLAVLIRRC